MPLIAPHMIQFVGTSRFALDLAVKVSADADQLCRLIIGLVGNYYMYIRLASYTGLTS